MADSTTWDLTAETVMTAAHRIPVQETSAATRALYATHALMGGMEINNQTITTADVTGAVGQLYVCTISGLTADRNLTLPSANVGERVGVYIVDGDATYELILKGSASQVINGGSAATEWSRLFIANEMVIFRCIAANTWIVEYDGRIPCKGHIYRATSAQSITATGFVKLNLNAEEYDIGDICDITTNYRIDIRRTGYYAVQGRASIASLDDNTTVIPAIYIDGSEYSRGQRSIMNPIVGPNTMEAMVQADPSISAGSYVELYMYQNDSTSESVDHTYKQAAPYLAVHEVLR